MDVLGALPVSLPAAAVHRRDRRPRRIPPRGGGLPRGAAVAERAGARWRKQALGVQLFERNRRGVRVGGRRPDSSIRRCRVLVAGARPRRSWRASWAIRSAARCASASFRRSVPTCLPEVTPALAARLPASVDRLERGADEPRWCGRCRMGRWTARSSPSRRTSRDLEHADLGRDAFVLAAAGDIRSVQANAARAPSTCSMARRCCCSRTATACATRRSACARAPASRRSAPRDEPVDAGADGQRERVRRDAAAVAGAAGREPARSAAHSSVRAARPRPHAGARVAPRVVVAHAAGGRRGYRFASDALTRALRP